MWTTIPPTASSFENNSTIFNCATPIAAQAKRHSKRCVRRETAGDRFHIAILDQEMPGMDGETLARTIKADSELKDTVLVMLSSCGQRGDAKRMEDAGFSAYLTKPVRFSQILDTLRKVWALSRSNGEPAASRNWTQAGRIRRRYQRNLFGPNRQASADYWLSRTTASIKRSRCTCWSGWDARWISRRTERKACAWPSAGTTTFSSWIVGCRLWMALKQRRKFGVVRARTVHRIIVAMTANALQEDRERCLQAGMDDYISKPINRAELIRVLERFVPFWDQAAYSADPVTKSEAS